MRYINAKRKKKKYDGTSVLYQRFSCATRKYFEIAEALSKLQSSKAVRSGLIERDGRKGSSGDRSSSGETRQCEYGRQLENRPFYQPDKENFILFSTFPFYDELFQICSSRVKFLTSGKNIYINHSISLNSINA